MLIGALVTLTPKPGAERELQERVLDVANDVRKEPGNIMTLVFRDPEHPDDMLMLELFRDAAAMDEHKVAPGTVQKGPAIHALLAEPMKVRWLETLDWPAASSCIK